MRMNGVMALRSVHVVVGRVDQSAKLEHGRRSGKSAPWLRPNSIWIRCQSGIDERYLFRSFNGANLDVGRLPARTRILHGPLQLGRVSSVQYSLAGWPPWLPVAAARFHGNRVAVGFSMGWTRFHGVGKGFTGLYRVFLDWKRGFTEFRIGSSEFDRGLLGFTGFYWVLLGFTGFYWVLPILTGCDGALPGF